MAASSLHDAIAQQNLHRTSCAHTSTLTTLAAICAFLTNVGHVMLFRPMTRDCAFNENYTKRIADIRCCSRFCCHRLFASTSWRTSGHQKLLIHQFTSMQVKYGDILECCTTQSHLRMHCAFRIPSVCITCKSLADGRAGSACSWSPADKFPACDAITYIQVCTRITAISRAPSRNGLTRRRAVPLDSCSRSMSHVTALSSLQQKKRRRKNFP
jgi:hypothetical protein